MMELDDLDRDLLRLLMRDATQSAAVLGRTLGLSQPATWRRIRRLEDAGVIQQYHTVISPFESGYQLKAIITLRAFMGKLKPFLEKVQTFDEVVNCYRITGNENIVMEVILKNQHHLEAFIDQLITYGETKTQIVLSHVVRNKAIKP